MESPFYGNYWSQPARPRYSSNLRGIPVQPIHQNTTGIKPAAKVVQIPVQFICSDSDRSGSQLKIQKPKLDRSALALRIQKVFRGFRVRKCVKRIISIRKEVDEIERKLSCSETAELIRRDGRERLRVNETLMSLLLKLDSIRGVDSGVRDFRKSVIRKAISLQEKVDSIVTGGIQIAAEEKNQNDNIPNSTENQDGNGKSTDRDEVFDDSPNCNDEKTQVEGGDDMAPAVEKAEEITDLDEVSGASPNCAITDEETQVEGGDDVAPAVGKAEEITDLDEVSEASPDYTMNDEKTELEWEGDVAPEVEKSEEMREVTEEPQDCPMHEGVIEEGINELQRVDESKRNRELLEKMVEENGKMMRMMNELCKKNEVQTRMLNSLTQRVEQLEKAFVCDRLKNKKKKRNPSN